MKNEWWSCDGGGGRPVGPGQVIASRRSVLLTAGSLLAGWAGAGSALANLTLTDKPVHDRIMVVIFMRGGADGLNMVVPFAESAYYRARPTLAIAAPNDSSAKAASRTIDLNGFFGLHPSLAPIHDLYSEGALDIVHACGSNDQTRSHFEAMSTVERGAARDHNGPASGWLARHLAATGGNDSPLRAVAFGDTVPDALRGAPQAIAVQSLDDFTLQGGPLYEAGLREIYGGKDAIGHAGEQTLAVLTKLRDLDPKSYKPSNNANYPKSDLGEGLRQVACLVRSNVGLEVACLDKGGWDTHVAQGADTGWQASLMTDLASSIRAFMDDLGPLKNRVTLVAMSEFGRRVAENAGLGTDHGRGGPVFVFGGGLKKPGVFGTWPGLAPDQLDEVGDLRVQTDYRTVLSEVLETRLGCDDTAAVFPGFVGPRLGLFQA